MIHPIPLAEYSDDRHKSGTPVAPDQRSPWQHVAVHPAPVTPDPALSRRLRRQRLLLLVVVNALILAIGLVAMIDLRRLATPGGTALRWVQAAVFGDCADYLEFSVAGPDDADPRSPQELCKDLRTATEAARRDQLKIGLHLGPVQQGATEAQVRIGLTRDGKETPLDVHLVRRDHHWRVIRDQSTCSSVGCA